jgi:ATP-dependent Clp protease protease subunit
MEKTTMTSLAPMVIQREGNAERAMDIYSRLLQDRIIMLNGQVDMNSAGAIIAQLLHLEAEDPDADITMYINSPGGEVLSGLGIYDTMQYIKPDVRTICVGMAASMGSFLLMGGAAGKRYILPNCEVMIHQPSGGTQGKESDIERQASHIKRLKHKLYVAYQKHTGQTIEKLTEDMDRDNWLTAEQALEYHLVDKIVENRELAEGE